MRSKLLLPVLLVLSVGFAWGKGKKNNTIINLEQDLGIGDMGNTASETAEANEVKQPFTWTSAGDVLKYEIIIDRFDEGAEHYLPFYYHETNEEETESCIIYIDPILPVEIGRAHV